MSRGSYSVGFVYCEYAWPFVKCMYRTYSMLLKILPFALHTSPLSVQLEYLVATVQGQ
jgi:hypothetical protein